MTTAKIDRTSGCGGFLSPPTHPEHTISVKTYDARGTGVGCMSLTTAKDCDYIPAQVAEHAAHILAEWERPSLESAEVRDWVARVLGYFANCYRNPDRSGHEQWHASHLLIVRRNPLDHVDDHAGVHLIRHFYPEYVPTAEDFAGAYWGTKP
jgi:hypothetical protein